MQRLNWLDVVKALSLGPGMAAAGFFGAVLDEAFRGTALAPFTSEFNREYDGLWLVPGAIGLAMGLVSLVSKLRGTKGNVDG
jgi:hypothetical protein